MKKATFGALGSWMKDREANALTTLAQLTRGGKPAKLKCSESVRVTEAIDAPTQAPNEVSDRIYTPMVKVVLITEGLGNRRNMNFYGPEAISGAPAIFEGKPCFIDHPTESDTRDIPERRVRDKCGYFKNCHTETMDGATALVGELYFDVSESGREGYMKALTALKYRREFPSLDSEYVGLSINADGETERREVMWEGETLDVNYVTRFTGAGSCDIVTMPARGGRFLALVESAAGAKRKKEESMQNPTLEKALKAAHTALEEAVKESDPVAKAAKVQESFDQFNAFLTEAKKDAEDEKKESKKEDNVDDMDEADDKKKEGKKKEKKADEDDSDAVESKRLAVASLAKESGVELPEGKLAKLAALPLKEAKAEIAEIKVMVESIVKKAITGMAPGAARFASLTEAQRKEVGQENNHLFADLVG